MRIANNQTYWIDRLIYINVTRGNLWKQEIYKFGNSFWVKLQSCFQSDFFKQTVFVKNLDEKLARIDMTESKYKVWKGGLGLCGLVIGLFIYIFSTNMLISPLILVIPFFTVFGFFLTDWYVLDKDQELSYRIHHEFPRFMDLLHLYTASAAYENIGTAIYAISHTMHGALAKQLQEITAIQRFVNTDKFLDEFEKRISTPMAKDLVSTLRLTQVYGGNISEKIGILADEAHKARMQNAKRQGQKASAALLVPLMLFHFPVAVVIFLAPTALALRKVFGW